MIERNSEVITKTIIPHLTFVLAAIMLLFAFGEYAFAYEVELLSDGAQRGAFVNRKPRDIWSTVSVGTVVFQAQAVRQFIDDQRYNFYSSRTPNISGIPLTSIQNITKFCFVWAAENILIFGFSEQEQAKCFHSQHRSVLDAHDSRWHRKFGFGAKGRGCCGKSGKFEFVPVRIVGAGSELEIPHSENATKEHFHQARTQSDTWCATSIFQDRRDRPEGKTVVDKAGMNIHFIGYDDGALRCPLSGIGLFQNGILKDANANSEESSNTNDPSCAVQSACVTNKRIFIGIVMILAGSALLRLAMIFHDASYGNVIFDKPTNKC